MHSWACIATVLMSKSYVIRLLFNFCRVSSLSKVIYSKLGNILELQHALFSNTWTICYNSEGDPIAALQHWLSVTGTRTIDKGGSNINFGYGKFLALAISIDKKNNATLNTSRISFYELSPYPSGNLGFSSFFLNFLLNDSERSNYGQRK